MGYIYKITNLVNHKIYIGQTSKTIQERFNAHIQKAHQHTNRYLYDAMNKYGVENFIIEEIEEVPKEKLDEREIYWIAYYDTTNKNNGYNMTTGGGGGDTWTNNPHKEETSKKISQANKGKHKLSKEQRSQIIETAKLINTIPVDKNELEKDIKNFMSIEDICKKYGIGRKTFYNKCKIYFGKTPTEIRGDKLTHTNTMKIDISQEELIQLVEKNKNLQEMADYFKVSKETVRRRIIEIYGKNLREVRKDVESQHSNA